MDDEPKVAWTHSMVVANTIATIVGGVSGLAALAVSLLVLLRG